VPLLPTCNDIVCVQSYCARPCVPPASNRKPPVVRMVAVMLETPSTSGPNVCSPVIVRYGSPLIVSVCDRQSLNSIRDEEVTVPGKPGGVVLPGVVMVNVIVIDPPPGHARVRTFDSPPGVAATSMPVASVSVAPTMPCAAAGLMAVGGVTVEGPDGELPPHPAVRPQRPETQKKRMAGVTARCARMSGILRVLRCLGSGSTGRH